MSKITVSKSTDKKIVLVGIPGLEPGTSSLSGMRSNQLSYMPSLSGQGISPLLLVELKGVEPLTFWMQTRRSSQLSYSPGNVFVLTALKLLNSTIQVKVP